MARSELLWGHRAEAERIARDAVAVMEDVRTRLQKLKPADQLAFEPLVGELQRVINLVKTETGQR
jgi:hypothetical protein